MLTIVAGTHHSAPVWSPVDHDLGLQAGQIARHVAVRLSDPRVVQAAMKLSARQSAFPEIMRWSSTSTASGDAGLAMLAGYLDVREPEAGWDEWGHALITAAAREAEHQQHSSVGLFSGLSGLALGVSSLSRGGTRYGRLTGHLDSAITTQAEAAAAALRPDPTGIPVWTFDVISGLSGTAAYLLTRVDDNDAAKQALLTIVWALVNLWTADTDPPAWHTPPAAMEKTMARQHPQGNLNCGLAHGIPGVLAILSLCWAQGVRVTGCDKAISEITDWLGKHRTDDHWGPNWAAAVPLPLTPGPTSGNAEITRSAWCYGAPGVARALWLAAEAIGDNAARRLALATMAGVYRRPIQDRRINSPTFCHGVAGLLQITLRFLHDTGLPMFGSAATTLLNQLVNAYEPDRPTGYYSLEPGGMRVDQPGLLDGSAGVALTLLAASGGPEPSWDRLFLLS